MMQTFVRPSRDLGTEMLPIVNALADFGNYYKSVVDRS